MAKVCECCREKIVAAFKDQDLPIEMVEAFIDMVEKSASTGVALPHLKETISKVIDEI